MAASQLISSSCRCLQFSNNGALMLHSSPILELTQSRSRIQQKDLRRRLLCSSRLTIVDVRHPLL